MAAKALADIDLLEAIGRIWSGSSHFAFGALE